MGILLSSFFVLCIAIVEAAGATTDCEEICEKCTGNEGEKGRCLIVCPTIPDPESLCKPPLKYVELAIGISIGLILCIIIIMGGLLCARFRRRRKERIPRQNARELKKFHKELDRLRPHAYTFLGMLNNIRRQVREMYRAGNNDAAVICGRSISDLAKILMLINRRDIPVVPPDWPRLLCWAERLLERSALTSQQPQISQLIQFLQAPSPRPREVFGTNQSTPMSTLKPPAYDDSIPLQEHSSFSQGKLDWTPDWDSFQSSSHERVSTSNEDAWQSRQPVLQRNLWIDDDFCMTTFRPQDEIVTVL